MAHSRVIASELLSTYATLLGLSQRGVHGVELGRALRMAGGAVSLAAVEGWLFGLFGYHVPVERIIPISVLIILTWLVCTAIFVVPERRRSESIAMNLNIASFWLAVTVFVISAAYVLFPQGNDESLRVAFVMVLLPLFVVAHVLRTHFLWQRKIFLIVALSVTNGLMAWRAVLI